MKKLLTLSAIGLALTGFTFSVPSYADHHGGDKKGKMFEKHDLDGNGSISKDEFMKAHEDKFNKIDANGNGEISKEESKAKREEMREKRKERREERQEKKGE